MYRGRFLAIDARCVSNAGLIPGGVGEKDGLTEGEGVAWVFQVTGEELIEGRVGVGFAEMLTMEVVGDEAPKG